MFLGSNSMGLAARARVLTLSIVTVALVGCGEGRGDEDSDGESGGDDSDEVVTSLGDLPSLSGLDTPKKKEEPSEKSVDTEKKKPKPKPEKNPDDEESGTTGPSPDGGTGGGGEDEPKDDESGGSDPGGSDGDEVPKNVDYCKDVAKWDPKWSKLEDEIVAIVNRVRAEGADCGAAGKFEPTGPVKAQPNLRCAARVHSKDMAEKGYFAHLNKEGESPFKRMEKAGFKGGTAGENIAAGNSTAEATMQQWIKSDGHCSNLMNPRYKYLGVGYFPLATSINRHYWTQNFGG